MLNNYLEKLLAYVLLKPSAVKLWKQEANERALLFFAESSKYYPHNETKYFYKYSNIAVQYKYSCAHLR